MTDPGDNTVDGYTIHWGDGTSDTFDSNNPLPENREVTHTYTTSLVPAGQINVDVTDEDGTHTAAASKTVAVAFDLPPVFAINTGVPLDPGYTADWQPHALVETGTDLYGGYYELQMPATDAEGPVTYAISGDPPADAAIDADGLFTCTFLPTDDWRTYDCYITATDSAGQIDRYELVFNTNIWYHGESMAAGSSWRSINENTSATVEILQIPGEGSFTDVDLVFNGLLAEGTLDVNGSPAETGVGYDPSDVFQYFPMTDFCGLDTIRYHFNYLGMDDGNPNELVGPLDTNVATAAIQVGPWVRIVGGGVFDETQYCDPGQVNLVQTQDVVIPPGQAGVKTNFSVYLNNPREDGVPTAEKLVFHHSDGLSIFDADGNELHDGDSITVMVSGPVSGDTQIPFSVEHVGTGSGTYSFWVDRYVWSCQERTLPGNGGLAFIPGWYFDAVAQVQAVVPTVTLDIESAPGVMMPETGKAGKQQLGGLVVKTSDGNDVDKGSYMDLQAGQPQPDREEIVLSGGNKGVGSLFPCLSCQQRLPTPLNFPNKDSRPL